MASLEFFMDIILPAAL